MTEEITPKPSYSNSLSAKAVFKRITQNTIRFAPLKIGPGTFEIVHDGKALLDVRPVTATPFATPLGPEASLMDRSIKQDLTGGIAVSKVKSDDNSET